MELVSAFIDRTGLRLHAHNMYQKSTFMHASGCNLSAGAASLFLSTNRPEVACVRLRSFNEKGSAHGEKFPDGSRAILTIRWPPVSATQEHGPAAKILTPREVPFCGSPICSLVW
jgi:hypothetical protein